MEPDEVFLEDIRVDDEFEFKGIKLVVKKAIRTSFTNCRFCFGFDGTRRNEECDRMPNCTRHDDVVFVAKENLEAYAAESVALKLSQ